MRIPLAIPLGARNRSSLSKDGALINCFVETTESGEKFVVDRPGVSNVHDFSTDTARGQIYWNGEIVSIFGTTLRHNSTSISTGIGGTVAPFEFVPVGTATKYLFFSDGTNAYYLTTAWSLTTINDADFTGGTPYVLGVVALDSYIFVMDDDGKIQDSDLITGATTPNTWSALNFITAESEADAGVYITRQLNYVCAMKSDSIEFFYDAANSTGSPLARVESAKKSYGCANARTVARIGDIIFLVANTRKGRTVVKLENMQDEIVSTKAITKVLFDATLTDAAACMFRVGEHTFYMLTLPTDNVTLVYDIKEGLWHRWTDASGNYWPYVNAASDGNTVYYQHRSTGNIVKIAPSVFTDETVAYTCEIRTEAMDFGTNGYKTMKELEVTGDLISGTLSVSYSDNDFSSFVTARTFDMSGRMMGKNWGKFRKRALKFTHAANGWRGMSADLEVQKIA